MDGKDLPCNPVRIGEPEFILPGKAASDVLFDFFENALLLKPLFPCCDIRNRLDLNPIPKWSTELILPVDDTSERFKAGSERSNLA
jgi:hypothetical protein